MAYQSVEARFLVQFDSPADARTFAVAMSICEECLLTHEEKSFEVDMTEEDFSALGCKCGGKGGHTVEVSFAHDFDVEVVPGRPGDREEPPEPACVEGYQTEKDVVGLLKSTIASCGVDVSGAEIECTMYESDSEEDILEREEDFRGY